MDDVLKRIDALAPEYAKAKAEQNRVAYHHLDRPRLEKKFERDYSTFYVSRLNQGVEIGRGSPYDSLLDFQVNQMTDLAIADYNESV